MKKQYSKPQISVVEINEADIICTSGGIEGDFTINNGSGIELYEEDF